MATTTLREFRIQQKRQKQQMKDSRETVMRLEREISSLQETARSNSKALATTALQYQAARAQLRLDEAKAATMSRGSPLAAETECTNPPVITSMVTVPLAGRVGRCQLAQSYGGPGKCETRAVF
jgi:hypothetical protein